MSFRQPTSASPDDTTDESREPRPNGRDRWTRRHVGEQRLIWTDLVPISLAACTSYDVVTILRKQRQELRGLEVVLQTTQDPDPPWTFRAIHQHLVFTGDVDDRKAARAIDLAGSKHCAVAATLRSVVPITLSHEVRLV